MTILYQDEAILVCLKPSGVNSTDIPGGLPELLREALGDPKADVRTVHRLDQVVGGLMLLARSTEAASELSRQVREQGLGKEYLAVVHFRPGVPEGTFRDLLWRDPARRMTMVVKVPGKDVQPAELDYRTLAAANGLSLQHIRLHTGRTHQIRVQFASRGLPLAGERKYSRLNDPWPIALWSCRLRFTHPSTGEAMTFFQP